MDCAFRCKTRVYGVKRMVRHFKRNTRFSALYSAESRHCDTCTLIRIPQYRDTIIIIMHYALRYGTHPCYSFICPACPSRCDKCSQSSGTISCTECQSSYVMDKNKACKSKTTEANLLPIVCKYIGCINWNEFILFVLYNCYRNLSYAFVLFRDNLTGWLIY